MNWKIRLAGEEVEFRAARQVREPPWHAGFLHTWSQEESSDAEIKEEEIVDGAEKAGAQKETHCEEQTVHTRHVLTESGDKGDVAVKFPLECEEPAANAVKLALIRRRPEKPAKNRVSLS